MKNILIAGLIAGSLIASAQEKFDKIFYLNTTVEGSDFTLTADNAVSTAGETKVKLKITNKTSDFLILKPEECVFKINGAEFRPNDKMLVIDPNGTDFRVLNIKGTDFNKVKDYSLTVSGIYKVSTSGTVIKADDFKLPASANDFKAGDFSCTMGNLYKETDKTTAKFKCVYNGNKVGMINPAKAALKFPDGAERANEKTNAKTVLSKNKTDIVMLMKGQDDNITTEWNRQEGGKATDMQKLELSIVWRDAFTEAVPVKLGSETLELKFDAVKSK
ncbi:MAG: hypothetical protein ACXVPQ_06825 [Bacteroidia bacterium]